MQIVNHIIMIDGEGRIDRIASLKAEMVARLVVDGGYSIEAAMEHYRLSASEVHAALAYYYDNQHALDSAQEAVMNEIRQNAMTLERLKAKYSR
jgi:hypothetical protein